MDQRTIELFFSLLRSAIRGEELTKEEKENFSEERLSKCMQLADMHDLGHLIAYSLKKNGLSVNADIERKIFKAAYRYEQLNYEYEQICLTLENVKILFIPLKGSILRRYYPEPWMRTSCDVDILVHKEDLDKAVKALVTELEYDEKEKMMHDVSLYTQGGNHIELHFDLVEEGRANNAIATLSAVWENVSLKEGCSYFYEMTDEFFYFYHIAHMAKHFETGGCGIRPFIDLWILDNIDCANKESRDKLLAESGLLTFTNVARKLSAAWLNRDEADTLTLQMQDFILRGGVYGSYDNRVVLQQKNKGGKTGYILSRAFLPFSQLKRLYPILEKHPWLTPFMHIRRWFKLLNPVKARRTKDEIRINSTVDQSKADEMKSFLDDIGL